MINLTKWNVWSSYTSFFVNELEFDKVAHCLVESGLCQFTFHSHTNRIVWSDKGNIKEDNLQIDLKEHSNKTTIKFPKELKDYPLECAYQSGNLRFFENYLLHEFVDRKYDYIRGFAGVILIRVNDHEMRLYPQFKIWGNGVFSLLLRIFSPSQPISEDSLINNYINLFRHNAAEIYFPPKVLELDAIEYISDFELKKRDRSEFNEYFSEIHKQIDEKSFRIEDPEFEFIVCPADIELDEDKDEPNFMTIVDYMFSSLSASINQLYRNDISKNKKNIIGDFWSGRPQVMIIDFEENNAKASENDKQFITEFSKILSRTSIVTQKLIDDIFHNSLRIYEDYSCYLNKGIGLWVYSREGMLSNNEYADVNNGHLIYPLQIQAELMDYLYLSYKQLYELARLSPLSFDFLIHLKSEYHSLNEVKNNVSSFGEIQNLFTYFYSTINLEYWERSFNEIVELKKEVSKDKLANHYSNIALLLSLIFGAVGVLPFSTDILIPIWNDLGFWSPHIKSTGNLFFFLVTSVIFLFVLLLLNKILKKVKWV